MCVVGDREERCLSVCLIGYFEQTMAALLAAENYRAWRHPMLQYTGLKLPLPVVEGLGRTHYGNDCGGEKGIA
jgi:hypothetical protein